MHLSEMVKNRADLIDQITDLSKEKVRAEEEILHKLIDEHSTSYVTIKWDQLNRDSGVAPDKIRKRDAKQR